MSNEIMLSLINNNNRPNIKPPPPPSSLHDGGSGSTAAKAPSPSGLNPLVKPFAPRSLSGETNAATAAANPLQAAAALRAARARAAEHQVCSGETTS